MKHENSTQENNFFGKGKPAPFADRAAGHVGAADPGALQPCGQLFVGRYSASALTALAVIYPLQLVIVALAVGCHAFPIIGSSFLPAVVSLMTPVFFQAIGYSRTSLALSLLRQIVCLLPLFWLLPKLGLGYTWFAFPLSCSPAPPAWRSASAP